MILCCICLILLFISCKDSGPESPTFTPGKRNYVWAIDSVDYGALPGKIELRTIWGASSQNLWGSNGFVSDVRDCLWHYDGMVWKRATAGTPITEFTGNKAVNAVWGSSANDIWAVGRKLTQTTLSAFIMHYDGTRWLDATPGNVEALDIELYGILGNSQRDIWVYGYEHAIHFDGNQWQVFRIRDSVIISHMATNGRYIYASVYNAWGNDVSWLYMVKRDSLVLVDSTTVYQPKFGKPLWVRANDIVTFSDGVILTSILANGLVDRNAWRREFTTVSPLGYPFVYSSNHVFAVGPVRQLYHYNGEDWRPLTILVQGHEVPTNASFAGTWSNGNEVVISDVVNGVMYHGR